MKRVAKFRARLKFTADAVSTSPLPRASQTAEMVAKGLGIELKTEPALAHGFSVERLRHLVAKADADCVMVVGHEPNFSEVIKELTGGEIKLSNACVALLEVNRGCTSGKLLWLFPPKISTAASY